MSYMSIFTTAVLQGREEGELPEHVLGTVRLNRVKLDSAVPLKVCG